MTTYYTVTGQKIAINVSGQGIFRSGPGGTVTGTKTGSGTTSFAVRAGAEAEAGMVLAKAKVSVDATLTVSHTESLSRTYTRSITAGKYGNMRWVNWGKRVTYAKYRTNSNCSRTTLATGVIDYPTDAEGFKYWED
ncbi:MAG: hypothetical protein U0Q15_04160 [Kineosporiaceae bacterium]